MKASIVIRTYNESKHLPELLQGIQDQHTPGLDREVVLVDSGSTDGTLAIAEQFGVDRIERISKEEFSFGRSLNLGCAAATGDALVFISGHCVPARNDWLVNLVRPLGGGEVVWTYGRQLGNGVSRFSECRVFDKYFPEKSRIPQKGFYCNNANSALLSEVWDRHRFDEELTGLEDMHLARQLVERDLKIGYVAEAPVYHIHEENWSQVKRRFEREAIALQHIMPEVHVSFFDFMRYLTSGILLDSGAAVREKRFLREAVDIFAYRLAQYWGVYRGNHFHRQLSKRRKERYFYPR